ncbi:hypothetical protein M3J09_010236 [Ascochyta lentis]
MNASVVHNRPNSSLAPGKSRPVCDDIARSRPKQLQRASLAHDFLGDQRQRRGPNTPIPRIRLYENLEALENKSMHSKAFPPFPRGIVKVVHDRVRALSEPR